MTESQFQAKVIGIAKQLGWQYYHTHDSRGSEKGFPDLVLIRDRVIFAELKTKTGRLTEQQIKWGQALFIADAEYYLWRPDDMPHIVKILTNK